MTDTRIEIKGLKELQRQLSKLPERSQRNVIRTATRAGAKVIAKAAQNNAPVRQEPGYKRLGNRKATKKRGAYSAIRYPGFLKEKTKAYKRRRTGPNVNHYFIGAGPASYYGRMAEFGTAHQPARPWFRPAYESSKDNAINTIKRRLRKGILKEAKKLR